MGSDLHRRVPGTYSRDVDIKGQTDPSNMSCNVPASPSLENYKEPLYFQLIPDFCFAETTPIIVVAAADYKLVSRSLEINAARISKTRVEVCSLTL